MLVLIIVAVLGIYLMLAWGMLYFSRSVLFPLGHVDRKWLWTNNGSRLLLYLQGNAEIPSRRSKTISFFIDQGWDVLSVGYTDNFDVTDDNILRLYNKEASKYSQTAIFARSIGTCFAPQVCKNAAEPDKIQWVIYMTPVTSVSRLANWHLWNFMSPFVSFLHGANRGYSQHNTAHRHHVLLATEDMITPYQETKEFLKDREVDVYEFPHTGHNDIETSPDYISVLQKCSA